LTITNGIIGRFDRGDTRVYIDPVDAEVVLTSVTTVNSATESKPFLTAWAAKLAAIFAVEKHDFIGSMMNEVGAKLTIDMIKKAAEDLRGLKADIGTHQHDILEALLLDMPIPVVPEHLVDVEVDGETVDHDAISDGLLNFLADQNIDPELAEATVANPAMGYAGTLDLIAYFPDMRLPGRKKPGARGLIDLKTGSKLDASMKRQLAAYRNATEIWVDNLGNKVAMPEVDFCAVLHVRREYDRGYKFLEVEAGPKQYQHFLDDLKSYNNHQEDKKVLGRALYKPLPDGTQPPPLLEDIDAEGFNRCKGKLIAAGLRTLTDLTAHTPASLKALDGVGPAAIKACAALLDDYGLTFASEEVAPEGLSDALDAALAARKNA
jgi:hypothetical protein